MAGAKVVDKFGAVGSWGSGVVKRYGEPKDEYSSSFILNKQSVNFYS